MDLTHMVEQDGITLRHEAGTNGGEFAGACPFCGGRDRFRVWPVKGRYWCRGCGARGDAIQYLRDRHHVSYREACTTLGIELKGKTASFPARQEEKPKADGWLNTDWQMSAWVFLKESRAALQSPEHADEREYLKGRGLDDETISSLGWNPAARWDDRELWGLPPETNQRTGKPKKVWLPQGIVIPIMDGDLIHRLRIRLSPEACEQSRQWTAGKRFKYVEVSGSGNDPLFLPGIEETACWAVVESELDALLIHQEAGDMVNVLGLGSAQAKPPAGILKQLSGDKVLVCLDYDEAGWKAARGFWDGIGKYWPVPDGKDPGDYVRAGGDIRAWIEAGLIPPIDESPARKEVPEMGTITDIDPPAREEAFPLPCTDGKIRCFHHRQGQCFYKRNWGPVSEMGACPMLYGQGHRGEAHPALEALERQRRRERAWQGKRRPQDER